MVRIDRVTTRGGDGGETSLGDGTRIAKTDPRIAALGAVDEVNAVIGVLRTHTRHDADADAMLARIQNDLFDLGADLCVPGQNGDRLRMTEGPILRLEAEIEAMRALVPPLRSFVLPGGTDAAAHAHLARVVARRAERDTLAVEAVNPAAAIYLNRLSDHLFLLARLMNDCGAADIVWIPGANR
ncbi:cob(I)yrinic acid a,c-diamide adenosyltransferase [Rhodopila sp.]|jgi:cob(I)alamin adenosyltransferase|uniref:cob(I)yrinic acid a,c-diamide adenosyltransferase n=1 Tax=Rhodopila sp. TaxID=2480087 RepID=UPI002C116BD3|nr:cob(I)yrinic acid a,c-diamide adenosyltransferase [Rhodopila sp.]HVZ08773.1 cob(I)yrinic acid a,c-diamide adenosyltransferase [Rhodopila sp.]